MWCFRRLPIFSGKFAAVLIYSSTKVAPNLLNLDHALMSRVTVNDPDNAHGVVYTWGTNGIGYNEKKVAAVLPNTALDSWALVFDPKYASKLAKCGLASSTRPCPHGATCAGIPGQKSCRAICPQDMEDVERLLTKIRPYIRTIDSAGYIERWQTAIYALLSVTTATSSRRADARSRR